MSFESPVMEPEAESGEKQEARFSRSKALAQTNQVVDQIRAYTKHVQEMVEKTGKTSEQIVAQEQAEVSKVGITEFLQNLKK